MSVEPEHQLCGVSTLEVRHQIKGRHLAAVPLIDFVQAVGDTYSFPDESNDCYSRGSHTA